MQLQAWDLSSILPKHIINRHLLLWQSSKSCFKLLEEQTRLLDSPCIYFWLEWVHFEDMVLIYAILRFFLRIDTGIRHYREWDQLCHSNLLWFFSVGNCSIPQKSIPAGIFILPQNDAAYAMSSQLWKQWSPSSRLQSWLHHRQVLNHPTSIPRFSHHLMNFCPIRITSLLKL